MIYKLYIMSLKEEYSPDAVDEDEFENFYDQHNVEVIGEWINKDNPKELYFMTAYEDQEHYESFTKAMEENEKYQQMTEELMKLREDVKGVTLESVYDT